MMSYKEYIDYQYKRMKPWKKLLFNMSTPDWRSHYYRYVLKCVLESKNLEEAKEKANIALM